MVQNLVNVLLDSFSEDHLMENGSVNDVSSLYEISIGATLVFFSPATTSLHSDVCVCNSILLPSQMSTAARRKKR